VTMRFCSTGHLTIGSSGHQNLCRVVFNDPITR